MEGNVLVDGLPAEKPGQLVSEDAAVRLKEPPLPYVSRGGLKLEGVSRQFGITFEGKVAMDVGASTGGFTDYMLKKGARKVYAIDVGYGQLHWSLRKDPRVVVIERTNVRYLKRDQVPEDVDVITVDVSFISLKKVIPVVKNFLKKSGEIIMLVKPQFEVGKNEVEKGGVIRSEEKRRRVLSEMLEFVETQGFEVIGSCESPIRGQKGNIEYFIYMRRRR